MASRCGTARAATPLWFSLLCGDARRAKLTRSGGRLVVSRARSELTDLRVLELADEIILAQRREIAATDRDTGAPERTIDRWFDEWKPELIERISAVGAVEFDAMADDDLWAHLTSLSELFAESPFGHPCEAALRRVRLNGSQDRPRQAPRCGWRAGRGRR